MKAQRTRMGLIDTDTFIKTNKSKVTASVRNAWN